MPGKRRGESEEPFAAQPLELLSGSEALLRVERAICPDAVARDPAVAEGLALTGVRAASLANGLPAGVAGGITVGGGSCVHHLRGAPGTGAAGVFELAATSVQEAVDHCAAAPEPEAGPGRVLELAREALESVNACTARPGDVVDYRGKAEAEVVLVSWGSEAAGAQEAARALSDAGISAGALSVKLVRPFPAREVREVLSRARSVFVVDSPERGGALLESVRIARNGGAEVQSLPHAAPARLLEALAERLPEPGFDPRQQAPLPEPPRRRLVVAPAGPWGEETARRVAGALGQLGPLRVARSTRHHLGATVLAWDGEALPKQSGDLLLASHPAVLGRRNALALVRAGGTVLVLSEAKSSDELAGLFDAEARALLRDGDLRVHWVAAPETGPGEPTEATKPTGREGEGERASSLALVGAALTVLHAPGEVPGAEPAETVAAEPAETVAAEPAETVAAELEAAGRPGEASWLRHGAVRVQPLDRESLDPSRHLEEVDFRPRSTLLRMPEVVEDPERSARWAERIWRFHRTGKGAFGALPQLPMRPAALRSLAGELRNSAPHPFVLVPPDEPDQAVGVRGLRDLLRQGIAALEAEGRASGVLAENTERLAILAGRLLARRSPGAELESLLSEAGERLADELDLPDDDRDALIEELTVLRSQLPPAAVAVELRSDTPLRLYLAALEAVRAPLRRRFDEELRSLRERLRDLLQLDRLGSSEGLSPEALAASLGRSGSEYLDPEALSRTLSRTAATQGLEPERRRRVEATLAAIERHLEQLEQLPPVVLVRPPELHLGVEAEQREHPDPLAAAVGVFDGLSQRMVGAFRAARVARLEAAGAYRPELHDELIAELDWEALTADELRVVPAVAAVTSGGRLRQRDQASLSGLLQSSRPVHVIVQDQVGAADEAEDLSRFHVDLGYLVVAHREACAVGSTLARPERLMDGLVRAARALRPAVALVRLPASEPVPWRALLAEAALHGRACPEFRYDPDAGPSWADRFDLTSNPQPERSWPVHELVYLEDGEERTLEVAFTFADAVALEPAYLRHLQVIPRVAWDDAQLPLADYLERFDPEGRERWVPYLWVMDDEDRLQRAVVTRELAMACGDRLRAWRILQELAGYQNVFAERAATAARERALAEAAEQRAELEQAHAAALEEVRRDAAQDSLERLAEVLLSPEGVATSSRAAVAPAVPPPTAPVAAQAPVEAAAEAAPVEEALEEEEILAFDEPYIDTPLCTTCNECTNLNSQLFQYNAEKQAFIADPAAGSFADLVKAAELCPARCIHPGKPRSDDSSATADLLERAAPFNG
jgi:ferredoxin